MKYFIHTLLLIFLVQSQVQSQANEKPDLSNSILKIDPFLLGRSEYKISYEHYINNRKQSVLIAPSIFLKQGNDESVEGYEIMGQYRIYLTEFNKETSQTLFGLYNIGIYAGLYGLYYNVDEKSVRTHYNPDSSDETRVNVLKSVSSFEGGTIIGVQTHITRRLVLDFYIGGGIRKSDFTDSYLEEYGMDYYNSDNVWDPQFTGIKPKLGLSVGITLR